MNLDLASIASQLNVRPTALDRMIGYFSPGTALRRMRARAGVSLMSGGYVGGRNDRRSMRNWNPAAGSANADTLLDLPTLRARSRDLIRNTPLAAGAHSTIVTNVIGTGLQLHAHVDRDLLGLTDEEANAWERRAEMIFWAWAGSRNCDITREQSFAGLQDLAFRAALESGDVLLVRRFQERRGDVLGTKVQLIEGDRVSNPNLQMDSERLAAGVAVDGNGAPIGYWVRNTHPGDFFAFGFSRQSTNWSQVPARGKTSNDLISKLVYRRMRPGQVRGVPLLAPVIEPLKQLDRYTEAEIAAAVVNALLTVFIKSDADESAAQFAGTGDPEQGLKADEIKLGEGSVVGLLPGEDVSVVEPKRPNSGFDAFVVSVYRQIGVGLELPFEVLIKHFQSSYSAARAALLEAWKMYRTRRAWIAQDFCQPCYEWVIVEAIARGLIEAPGFDDPVVRAAWLNSEWVGTAQGQIDPEKEARGAEKRIAIGVSTVERETAELTGMDWEEVHVQRAKEHRMRVADGLEQEAPTPDQPVVPVDDPALVGAGA